MSGSTDTEMHKDNSTATRIERNFFAITRWFILICAVVTVFATVAMLASAAYEFTRSPNASISPDTPRYQALREQLETQKRTVPPTQAANNAILQKERQAAKAQAELEFEKRIQPIIEKIYGNLASYAKAMRQPAPAMEAIQQYIKGRMTLVRDAYPDRESLQWKFVDGLAQACGDLADDAQRLVKLPDADDSRVEYTSFIQWYTDTFFANLRAETSRVQQETMSVAAGKAAASGRMMMAAAAFGVFAALTILLVLLRIERNTRNSNG